MRLLSCVPDRRCVSDQHVTGCELPSVSVLQLPDHHLAIMAPGDHGPLVAQQVDGGDAVGGRGASPQDDRDHQVGGARHLDPAPL